MKLARLIPTVVMVKLLVESAHVPLVGVHEVAPPVVKPVGRVMVSEVSEVRNEE